MPEDHGPEARVIKFDGRAGDEWRDQQEQHRQESRRLYVGHLAPVLARLGVDGDADGAASEILDALCRWSDVEGGDACRCSCHPRLPESDLHGYGFDCGCRHTFEERRAHWNSWMASIDEYWASPDGQRVTAARQAEEDDLQRWLHAHPDVEVSTHGGMAPEQWEGTVDGHSFYFRERHDDWRIEVDLRPSGRFYRAWSGQGDLDDDASFEMRETEEGEIIAEGTTSADGYGETPAERIRFIAGHVRDHLRRRRCRVHLEELEDLELLFGGVLRWCPDCGARLVDDT